MIRMDSGGGGSTVTPSPFLGGDPSYDWGSEENAGK